MPTRLLLLLNVLLFNVSFSQGPVAMSSSEIMLAMKKLNVLGSVLYVAAHPDDENTRLISYFASEKLYRTGYLSATRGDGGQNLVGDEQGIELGLIRTQELLAARRIDGGEQFFTRAYDFGYSKNPEETLSKWGRNNILGDMVWVIRKFRPDVIVTRFPTTGEGGHGHHTASAILALEAFSAAADPKQFTDQLKYVQTWQPKRIVWNTFNFGGRNTTSEDQLKIDVGGYNSLLGKSYGEIAALSRSQHKSQGFGVAAGRGESYEYFRHMAGSVAKTDLFEGVNDGWSRVKGGTEIQKKIASLISRFDHLRPERSVDALVEIYRSLQGLPDVYWKEQKISEIKKLIEHCSGLFMQATTDTPYGVQSDSLTVHLVAISRLAGGIELNGITSPAAELFTKLDTTLARNRMVQFNKRILIGEDNPVTQPYWLKEEMGEGHYNVQLQQKIGQPDVDPAIVVKFSVKIKGVQFDFSKPVRYRFTDPVKGEVYQPLVIVPRFTVEPDDVIRFSMSRDTVGGELSFRSRARNVGLKIGGIFTQPANRSFQAHPATFTLEGRDKTRKVRYYMNKNGEAEYEFFVQQAPTPAHVLPTYAAGDEPIYAVPAKSLREIAYDHIPAITYYQDVKVKVVSAQVKTEGKRIGYIPGAGDKVPQALEQMGFEVVLLTAEELGRNNLQQFDAIISGVRAYNTNDWLNDYYEKLMRYVREGGNLIVQYNTSSNLGPVRAKIGPYDFNISRTRITNEAAPVTFVDTNHAVLNYPNKITQDDFRGWIQERSIYHAANWDKSKFTTVLSMADPGETPDEGSLIIAKHGKGNFAYTGIVFFRQLPAGVSGAYRLLANLIAL